MKDELKKLLNEMLFEAFSRDYKQETKNSGAIKSIKDLHKPSSGKDFESTNFSAIRHNAKIDNNKSMENVGHIQLSNLFNKEHPDHKLENAWYRGMSPEQQKHVLKQHGVSSYEEGDQRQK